MTDGPITGLECSAEAEPNGESQVNPIEDLHNHSPVAMDQDAVDTVLEMCLFNAGSDAFRLPR